MLLTNLIERACEAGNVTITVGLLAICVLYSIAKVVYNVYFHPLAKFPGPWWAGASYWHEFWFDLIEGGQFFKHIVKWHEEYGPIIRITPSELHFNDPHLYDTIYTPGAGQKRHKDPNMARADVMTTSTLSTLDHDLHRLRRSALLPFFSKRAITGLEPILAAKVRKVVEKLRATCRAGVSQEEEEKEGEVARNDENDEGPKIDDSRAQQHRHHYQQPIIAMEIYASLTADVISHVCYGTSFGYLDRKAFRNELYEDLQKLLLAGPAVKAFPWITRVMALLPRRWVVWLSPAVESMFKLEDKMQGDAREALRSYSASASESKNTKEENGGEEEEEAGGNGKPQTVFESLCDPTLLPPQERTVQRLADEGLFIIAAGFETTSRFLTNITCFLLMYPRVFGALREELRAAGVAEGKGDGVGLSWNQLEKLPYLTAVIQEGLRFNATVLNRFPRVLGEEVVFGGWVLPKGTSIGAMPWHLNNHPGVFPDPHVFRPERWIEASERGENLSRYFTTFTKGSRMCAGINLAYAELYLMIAALVTNFDMELVDSRLEDVAPYRDYGMSFTKDWKYGIKFRVTKVLSE